MNDEPPEPVDRRFRALIERSWDAVALIAADGTLAYASPSTSRILGYTPAELAGQPALAGIHPQDRARVEALLSGPFQEPGTTVSAEFRYHHREGTWVWLEGTATNLLQDPDVGAVVANFRDVTERKWAEYALGESEARYRRIVDTVNEAIWVIDPESRLEYVNGRMLELLGYTREEVLGRPIYEVLDAGDREAAEEHVRRLQAGIKEQFDFGLHRKDGSHLWVFACLNPILDETGRYLGALGTFTDVTERKAAARALLASERRFRALIENSLDAVGLVAPDGTSLYASPAASRILGYPPEELVGNNAFDRLHPDDLPRVRDEFAGLCGDFGGSLRSLFRYRHQDGSWRWMETVGTNLLQEPSISAIVLNYRDVTDQHRAEESLKYVMTHARCLLWHGMVTGPPDPAGTYRWHIRTLDEEAAQQFLPLPVLPGEHYMRVLHRHKHPDDVRPMRETAARCLETDASHYNQEFRVVLPGGEVRWLHEEAHINPVEAGVWRLAGVFTEITELKRLETELRQRAADLAEADRRKDEFLAMLAHELRNPLAPMRTALEVLRLGGNDVATRDRLSLVLERQVRHMSRLMDDLLDVSRISRGTTLLRREPLELGRLVRDTVEDYRRTAEGAGVSLELELPDEPCPVLGDPLRLAQVIGNLLQNAVKFTGAGGTITAALRVQGTDAVLSVRDTGIGIAPELLPQVFNLFVQAERSPDRSRGGLGLGLALVRGLAELHGGAVRAASAGPGEGSQFTVTLPLLRDVPSGPAPAAQTPGPARSLRVLIVDDNRDAAETLRDLLELWGNEVAVCASGPEGIARAVEWQPDVVLLDIGLPGMDGYAVAAELRRDPRTASLHLIAVTGYGLEEDRLSAFQAGFDAHLIKPVDPEELRRQLEQR